MMPTFSPNSNSASFVPRTNRNVITIIAVATTDEKVRIKKDMDACARTFVIW